MRLPLLSREEIFLRIREGAALSTYGEGSRQRNGGLASECREIRLLASCSPKYPMPWKIRWSCRCSSSRTPNCNAIARWVTSYRQCNSYCKVRPAAFRCNLLTSNRLAGFRLLTQTQVTRERKKAFLTTLKTFWRGWTRWTSEYKFFSKLFKTSNQTLSTRQIFPTNESTARGVRDFSRGKS